MTKHYIVVCMSMRAPRLPLADTFDAFGPDGDRWGWQEFLAQSGAIFEANGDIPSIVHIQSMSRTSARSWMDRSVHTTLCPISAMNLSFAGMRLNSRLDVRISYWGFPTGDSIVKDGGTQPTPCDSAAHRPLNPHRAI